MSQQMFWEQARRSDPISSHIANALIANDYDLASKITNAALTFWAQAREGVRPTALFTDSELTDHIEKITGKRQQRSVIARARGLLEDIEPHPRNDPPITRIDVRKDQHGKAMMHFVATAALEKEPELTR